MFKICMKELVKKYNTRNVMLFCILVLFTVILMLSGNNVFKILASLSFVAAGVLNYFYENQENKKFSRLLLLGLICGLFGDIGILIDFQIGAVCFGVGRILFFCAKLFASDVFAWGFFARVCMLFFVLYV